MRPVVDLFCGCGGFSLGAKAAGHRIAVAVDCWEPALAVHQANHPSTIHLNRELGADLHYGGRRGVEAFAQELREIVPEIAAGEPWHLHGSPPCQELSTANPGGDRGEGLRLVLWFLELVGLMDPPSWSMEQVPTVARLLPVGTPGRERKLNAADFNVPQTRKRTFLGRGWEARRTSRHSWRSVADALPHLLAEMGGDFEQSMPPSVLNNTVDCKSTDVSRTITGAQQIRIKGHSRTRPIIRAGKHIGNRPLKDGESERSISDVSFAVATRPLKIISRVHVLNLTGAGRSTGHRAASADSVLEGPCGTITHNTPVIRRFMVESMGSNANRSADNDITKPTGTICGGGHQVGPRVFDHGGGEIEKVRSLTADETAILMGFPSDKADSRKCTYDFSSCKLKTDLWTLIGNAVCPPVAEAVMMGLLQENETLWGWGQ